MLNPTLVIARKEIVDSLRDVRSVISSLMYALMGPFVVMLVSMGTRVSSNPEAAGSVLPAMMWTLVSSTNSINVNESVSPAIVLVRKSKAEIRSSKVLGY